MTETTGTNDDFDGIEGLMNSTDLQKERLTDMISTLEVLAGNVRSTFEAYSQTIEMGYPKPVRDYLRNQLDSMILNFGPVLDAIVSTKFEVWTLFETNEGGE